MEPEIEQVDNTPRDQLLTPKGLTPEFVERLKKACRIFNAKYIVFDRKQSRHDLDSAERKYKIPERWGHEDAGV